MRKNQSQAQPRVLVVAPVAPPYGGMALQASRLCECLRHDGVEALLQPSNPPLTGALQPLKTVWGVRTAIRFVLLLRQVWLRLPEVAVLHLFACSWTYFFLVVCPVALLGRLRGTRTILNYRGGDAPRFFQWFGWLVSPIFRLVDLVIAPSAFLGQLIESRFGVRTTIVPNILDTSAFRFRARLLLTPRMVVARHLEPIYGIDSVLKAFRHVQAHYPDASLAIAGTGSQEKWLRSLAADWGLRNVHFLGHVRHADLPALYDQCDIVLNASVIDNFPGALLEASAAGLIVISTNSGGIPFIYTNEATALLVKPGDWKGLALAVERALECPSLAACITRQAAVLTERCEWTHVRQFLYAAYGFNPDEVNSAAHFTPARCRA